MSDFNDHYHDELRALLNEHNTVPALLSHLETLPAVWAALQAIAAGEYCHKVSEFFGYVDADDIEDAVDEITTNGDPALEAALRAHYGPIIRQQLAEGERQAADDRSYGNHS